MNTAEAQRLAAYNQYRAEELAQGRAALDRLTQQGIAESFRHPGEMSDRTWTGTGWAVRDTFEEAKRISGGMLPGSATNPRSDGGTRGGRNSLESIPVGTPYSDWNRYGSPQTPRYTKPSGEISETASAALSALGYVGLGIAIGAIGMHLSMKKG